MKVDIQKVEKVTITYDPEMEAVEAYLVCQGGGYSIRDSYSVKDDSMKYTGQAVLVADRPLRESYTPQTLIGELFAMFEATFGDTTPEGNTLWAYVRHACNEVERQRRWLKIIRDDSIDIGEQHDRELARLRTEVERLQAESEVWEKHGLTQIVEERDALRSALREILDEAVSVGQTCHLQFIYWCAYKASTALKEDK